MSYWTERRKIRKSVQRHLNDIANAKATCVSSACTDSSLHTSPLPNNCDSLVYDCDEHCEYESECPLPHTNNESIVQDLLSDEDTFSDDEVPFEEDTLFDKLSDWARKFNIPMNATSSLLSLLHDYHPELPRDSRTLLGTTTLIKLRDTAGGQYYHFGLKSSLLQHDLTSFHESCLSVQINIDGLPVFKSSNIQFWPILGMVVNYPCRKPFIIGVFCGNSKPTSVSLYLREFVDECLCLQKYGIQFGEQSYSFKISAIICDAPARSFVKGVKLYSGYYGCDKCKQPGVWIGKITFPDTAAALRKDEDFVHVTTDDDYFKEVSPLSELDVGLISDVPIDYMHQCCLGITKRILKLMMKGPLRTRIGSHNVSAISEWLISISGCVPTEFSRKPRSLHEIDRWKATEFRFFMLYAGPIILMKHVPKEQFENFMLYSTVMTILLSPKFSGQPKMVDYAEQLSKSFVAHFGDIYGSDQLVYNIHSIVHLAAEVRNHGHLDNISSFPFENYLGVIKRLIRKPSQPLHQLVRRISEQSSNYMCKDSSCSLKKRHSNGPLPVQYSGASQFRQLLKGNMVISLESNDNCFLIDERIACIENILQFKSDIVLVYRRFCSEQPVFEYPCSSMCLGISIVSNLNLSHETCCLSSLSSKCVKLPNANGAGYVIFPMHHTT